MPDTQLSIELRALIEEFGIDKTAAIIGLNRQTIANIVAGLHVRPGSKALARESLAKRAAAGAPRLPRA